MAFGSTHAALSFEAAFGGQGSLVPVPPKVRAGCGMALKFFAPESDTALFRVQQQASELDVESRIDGIFQKEGAEYRQIGDFGPSR